MQLVTIDITSTYNYWGQILEPSPSKIDDAKTEEIFEKIVSDKAYELLNPGSEDVTNDNIMGEGAKWFGGLKECGCEVLGRSATNEWRDKFEGIVVEQIRIKLMENPNLPSIRITAFATGLLFGEFVLLLKVIKLVSDLRRNTKIVFSCIDRAYETMKPDFETTHADNFEALSWKEDVDKAVDEFTKKIMGIINLPSVTFNSSIELRFFKSVKDYTKICRTHNEYQHDFLIGADRDNTDREIPKLKSVGTDEAKTIFLERVKDLPKIREY